MPLRSIFSEAFVSLCAISIAVLRLAAMFAKRIFDIDITKKLTNFQNRGKN